MDLTKLELPDGRVLVIRDAITAEELKTVKDFLEKHIHSITIEEVSEKVLGAGTRATVPHVASTQKYITATAAGTSLSLEASSALTAISKKDTDTFVKSYPGEKKFLSTTSITGVSGSTTASKATAQTEVSIPNVTSQGSASTWNFIMDGEKLVISGTNSVAPTLGTAINITPYSFADVTVPSAATPITVATGSLTDSDLEGGSIMTGLGTAVTSSAVTDIETAASEFIYDANIDKNPVITLTENDSQVNGSLEYTKNILVSGDDVVTFSTDHQVSVAKPGIYNTSVGKKS